MRIAAFSFGEFWAGYAVYDGNEMVDCGELTLGLDPDYLSRVLRVHELIRMLIKAYHPEIIVTDKMGLYEEFVGDIQVWLAEEGIRFIEKDLEDWLDDFDEGMPRNEKEAREWSIEKGKEYCDWKIVRIPEMANAILIGLAFGRQRKNYWL